MSLIDDLADLVRKHQTQNSNEELELPREAFCTGCEQSRPILEFFTKKGANRLCLSCRNRDYLKTMYIPYPPTTHCESCGDLFTDESPAKLDHWHDLNIFRGWLCERCNPGIGMFMNSVDRLQKAAIYLQKALERLQERNK